MAEGLLDRLSALGLSPPVSLPIERSTTTCYQNCLWFKNHKTLGSFAIDGQKQYVEGHPPPALHLPDKFPVDLNTGFRDAILIDNYNEYDILKRKYFFKWLLDNYLTSDGGPFPHDFIGFSGRFSDILRTTALVKFQTDFHQIRNGKWQMHAVKFNGSIFLLNAMLNQNEADFGIPSKQFYYGQRFGHILTADWEQRVVDEYSRTFVFRQCEFGRHKLLCQKEMNAIDSNGIYVEAKNSVQRWNEPGRYRPRLQLWAQCVPGGVDMVALGKRSSAGILEKIELVRTRDLLANHVGKLSAPVCNEFANRMLDWIREHMVEDDPTVVKKFRWSAGMDRVEMVESQYVDVACLLLPDWFVEGVEAKRRAAASV